jgi:hypothetical protein
LVPETSALLRQEEEAAKSLLYPRNPDLDPQLVWHGKDAQDAAPLAVANASDARKWALPGSLTASPHRVYQRSFACICVQILRFFGLSAAHADGHRQSDPEQPVRRAAKALVLDERGIPTGKETEGVMIQRVCKELLGGRRIVVLNVPVQVYDLSATPFYLRGSGETERTLFP